VTVAYAVGALHLAAVAVVFGVVRPDGFLGGDSPYYLAVADALRTGAPVAVGGVPRPIGYPLLLALASAVSPHVVAAAIVWNWGCYVLALYLVGRMTPLVVDHPRAPLLAGLLFATIFTMTMFTNLVLSDATATALMGLVAWCALRSRPVALGLAAAGLTLVRGEYALVLPVLLAVLGAGGVWRRRRWWTGAAASLACFAAVIGTVYAAVSVTRPAVSLTLRNTLALNLWQSLYDHEFTHLRLYRLPALTGTSLTDADVDRGLDRLATHHRGAPVPPDVLERVRADLRKIRAIVRDTGDAPLGYRTAFLARVSEAPAAWSWRIVRRGAFYLAGIDLDALPLRAMTVTLTLVPVATLGALALVLPALRVVRVRPLRLAVPGTLVLYTVLIHAPFLYEQRYLLPSTPLLGILAADVLTRRPRAG
jgi:hypothetical protein